MRRLAFLFFCILIFTVGCSVPDTPQDISDSVPTTAATAATTAATETTAATLSQPTEAETAPSIPVPVLSLTEEEQTMLLKIGMAERGDTDCTECIALVMRTVLNRVDSDRFGSSIHSVLHAQDQFTPVMDGSFYSAEPNDRCREALEMVICGWDESQGALYYEWCQGESWHSRNLHLLLQHCDTHFYD